MSESLLSYQSQKQDLDNKIEHLSDLIDYLKFSKEKLSHKIEKIEIENQIISEDIFSIQKSLLNTQKNLIFLQKSPLNKPISHKSQLVFFPHQLTKSSTSESQDSSEELLNDPNFENFIDQINVLKSLCSEQEQALRDFKTVLEDGVEDNEKILSLVLEIENEKKGFSRILGSFAARNSTIKEPTSRGSNMFINSIADLQKSTTLPTRFKLHKKSFSFLKHCLLSSHVFGLKV